MRTTIAASAALFLSTSLALDSLVAPSSIIANQNFTLTANNPDSSALYRIYLAATLSDTTGPTCFLLNSTTLPPSGALSLSIPASVGPDASYYSIAISPLPSSSSSSSATSIIYTPQINITGLTASYTPYETSLRGAPFYDADMLPCNSYACARKCADREFPAGSEGDGEEEKGERYGRMVECFGGCEGVGVEVKGASGVESQGGMGMGMTMTVSTSAEGEATATATTTTTEMGPSEADATEEAAAATSSGVAAPRQARLAGVIAIAGLAVVGVC
ncbi:uncharacterized protein MYCGRDRAFT_92048 [Zymoseptoria tritici IPO323]|uniref:Ca2+-modulated nonselective cation channel polycystin n=1 Tax=Zymoseptoria tritici (strain CBS 115943 / IPO323) TaxID=336722 RepID=F9X5X3_ZYMTI|nr:uncharacterized protein MYCGRDRAFT_92048 [Zymoseptoria tritici IPO323]EGP89019.1 hypothetical protein MYCGRDRAFT_92048 [Zymoseptoria tritici IPO323]